MKLSAWTIILVGLALALSVVAYVFFQKYQPNMTEAGYWDAQRDALRIEANKLGKAYDRVVAAKAAVKDASDRWQAVVAVKTPPNSVAQGGINLAVNAFQLTVDSRKFRNNVQRAVNKQIVRGGVRVVGQGPQIPDPDEAATTILADYYNYPAIPFPVVIFDLGTITVTGRYEQIMANVRSWKTMPRYLAVADGLQIQGTSPNLTGTYNVTIVGYLRGRELYTRVPEGTVTGGAGAGTTVPGAGAPAGAGSVGVR